MDIEALQRQALDLNRLFDRLNTAQGQPHWGTKDLMLGFTGDVGDLAKAIQVAEDSRTLARPTSIAHELSDCLWSVLVLADRYDIDLEAAFTTTMRNMTQSVNAKLTDLESREDPERP